MRHVAAIAIQNSTKLIKRATDIQIRDVNMPMRVGMSRLHKSAPLGSRLLSSSPETPRLPAAGRLQNTAHTAGALSHNTGIQHHVAQTPIACLRIFPVVVQYLLPLPVE